MEIWKQIKDYPYEVSNLGRIKSHNNTRSKKTKIINGTIMKNGYRTISINKKKYYVHRLVVMAFVDGYKEGLHVNHKNGNKLDNHFSNLEWVTNEENVRHSWRNGLVNIEGMRYIPTEEQKEYKRETCSKNKKVINTETGQIYRSCRELARQLGVDSGTIGKSVRIERPYKGVLYKYL